VAVVAAMVTMAEAAAVPDKFSAPVTAFCSFYMSNQPV